ncbi:MAG: hypothetical protein CSA62_01380 [Planctomycetota bacterium]|nr:MAG: hypothetical protein CSA62_01380 [Planctomycetota bacterium]
MDRAIRKPAETVAHILDHILDHNTDELAERLDLGFVNASSVKTDLSLRPIGTTQSSARRRSLACSKRWNGWALGRTFMLPTKPKSPHVVQLSAISSASLSRTLSPVPTVWAHVSNVACARIECPSLGDEERRQGRKTRSRLFNGYKRQIVTMADHGLIVGALVLPANAPEDRSSGSFWSARSC